MPLTWQSNETQHAKPQNPHRRLNPHRDRTTWSHSCAFEAVTLRHEERCAFLRIARGILGKAPVRIYARIASPTTFKNTTTRRTVTGSAPVQLAEMPTHCWESELRSKLSFSQQGGRGRKSVTRQRRTAGARTSPIINLLMHLWV